MELKNQKSGELIHPTSDLVLGLVSGPENYKIWKINSPNVPNLVLGLVSGLEKSKSWKINSPNVPNLVSGLDFHPYGYQVAPRGPMGPRALRAPGDPRALRALGAP